MKVIVRCPKNRVTKSEMEQMPLPEFMRQFIEITREAVQNEFPDSGNS